MQTYFENEYFALFKDGKDIAISILKKGFDIARFNTEVLTAFPRLKVTKFTALSSALTNSLKGPTLIGECIGVSEVSVSSDGQFAYAKLYMTKEEFVKAETSEIVRSIQESLTLNKVKFGCLDITKENMDLIEKFIIAKGIEPIPGSDATIKMYELEEIKPALENAGEVDHYELNVINKILENEWLGERIEPTIGISGTNVYGSEVKAPDGKQSVLRYDTKTVYQKSIDDETKTALFAKRNGAVVYIGESVSVLNAIEVDGTIGFNTGNIDFNGFVDIKGSVEDNFSVIADENIQIKGDMGIGATGIIESRHGDVYIRGGVAGRHKAIIKAKGNVYTKFASDCTIISEGTVNIGFYAMNCNIVAKELIFESADSRLIGGETKVDIQVKVGELGSKSASKTYVHVNGFNKEELRGEYDSLKDAIELCKEKEKAYKEQYETLKGKNSSVENSKKMDKAYTKMLDYKEKLKKIYDTRERFISYMHAKGEGEVKVLKAVYSNVFISIKDKAIEIQEPSKLGQSYFYDQDELKIE